MDWLNFYIINLLPIAIAHAGYLNDFPILLASCMKHNCNDFGMLIECMFVDSMQILNDDGYKRPVLDALCQDLVIKRNSHSALEDAYILKTVCNMKPEMLEHPHRYTFQEVNEKLPISIQKVYTVAIECASHQELEYILYEYVKPKTTLNINQICKIACWCFKDCDLYYK